MADDNADFTAAERGALLAALGIDVRALDRQTRAIVEALSEEVIALREEADALKAALAEAELLADHDTLCPMFNRRAFERELRREIALAGRFQTALSLIFIDLDNFKQVNDLFGHAAGDRVLLKVSEILLENTRETDIVGRLGGDEFGIVLAHASLEDSARKARHLAEAIDRLEVRDETLGIGSAVRIGASCGITAWRPGQSPQALIGAADQAMFTHKAGRKGEAAAPR